MVLRCASVMSPHLYPPGHSTFTTPVLNFFPSSHHRAPTMMASAAVRFVAGTKKSPLGTLYLQCHVKPGASRVREGVTAVTEGAVEMCVAAQAREGEANKAVIKLLSEVKKKKPLSDYIATPDHFVPIALPLEDAEIQTQVLGLPKSDLTITQGLKSRDKTVAVSIVQNPTDVMARVTEQLQKAANGG
ncbi:Duf167 domain protein [Colletotrichum higginsianum IMI 349063]|uniref:Duf167 domain protein n=1 Tax=Colletotrichum higginsianum (strain IMI 349063) TaxID=759273 RepID=A0A1B7YVS5_COLHI|nr:Duf167 domain protein [Colletotrichum higginsianum IMI 349063]OBR16123.1 Duf167 domain protein [Colletotrichum higginsianum IMI 349063]